MRIKTLIFLAALVTSTILSNIAQAGCKRSYVCDDWGNNCRYQDICDSSFDLPSTNLAPLPPIHNPGLKPLPSISLPPLGTSKCEYKVVNGYWQNVCY